ncbi:MAG TPA: hypothetical protein VLH61_12175 [Bacteroidales bacterium]|nr:hypothetical protein [Bacteroidales bacterium]
MGILKEIFKAAITSKYRYMPERYAGSFLKGEPVDQHVDVQAPRILYVCWTGSNPMSADRIAALNSLKKTIGVEVALITPENLKQYLVPGYPLHEGYEYLSLIQKSDYLRCYLMHHHGGGYSDIKYFGKSWVPAFEKLEKSPDKWLMGYREIGKRGVAKTGGNIEADLKKHWHILIGNGSFICKPKTPFTSEWYHELHARMDYFLPGLKKAPGDAFGTNAGYPIKWAYIMGYIFHPLCLKYHKRLLFSRRLRFLPIKYR